MANGYLQIESRRGGLPMRIAILVLPVAVVLFVVSSCGNKNAGPNSDRPHAAIEMRDGSTVTGAITATSPTEITLAGDDNTTHTIPTNLVRSINYDEAPVPAAESSPERKTSPASPSSPRAD